MDSLVSGLPSMMRKDRRNTLSTIVRSCVGIVTMGIGLGLASVTNTNAWAAEGPLYPLEPPDTSSPQATMRSYLEAMQAGSESFASLMERYQREPGLSFSPAAQKEYERLGHQLNLAGRCFDLQGVSPRLSLKVALDSMLLLKEVLDRLDLPALDSVPDAQAMEERNQDRWRIPHTEIVIAKVKEGARAGEYLFSPGTIDRLPEFFQAVSSLPYKPGSWEGVYAFYSSIGRHRVIPWKLTETLPSWAKTQVLEQALWRWVALGNAVLLIMAILVIIFRWSRLDSSDRPLRRYSRRIVMPAVVGIAAWFLSFLLDAINVTGETHVIIATILGGILFLAAAWAIVLIGHVLAEIIVTTPDIRPRSLDEAMARLAVRITTFIVAALVVLYGAEWLGLPVVPLIAGLGVGSLALALAAQPTIENFIAGLTLYADRQVHVGDFCRFGETLGTVEDIGMRSTRIRTLDHTVVSVPNADFSKSRLENYSARKKIWYHPRIRLPYDTSPDQLRYVLVEVHRLLCAHPRVLPEPAYIRFAEFGEHSLNLEVFAYIDTANYGEFLEIREDLNLRLMDVIASAGTHLAIPAQIEYQADASPLDPERKRQVEACVEEWRSRGALDLPKMPPEKIAELKDSLDYPPAGSSARKEPPKPT